MKTLWKRITANPYWYYALYVPVYLLAFWIIERFMPADRVYWPSWIPLDDQIPFRAQFVWFYVLWFPYLVGPGVYWLLNEPETYRRYLVSIMLSFSLAVFVCIVFPNCQNLRPAVFPRDNVLTRFTAWFYAFDTNTDVCPSLHVVGSLAAYFGLRDCRRFRSRGWQIGSALAAAAICLSTLFLKQHSAVDVLAALPLCAIAYLLIYRRKTV